MTELYAISGLRIKEYEIQGEKITFYAYSSKKSCKCPLCNKLSSRVRSGYFRKLMDLPCGGLRTAIMLKVRRFRCSNKKCRRKIFSERYDGYTKPYSRKTDRATDCLSSLLLEVSSSKGSYLSELIQMKQSSSTCLRMISSLPIPVYCDKTIIGIDDFAFRKGISYGSIIVDAENGRPVDLIESRDESEVTSWLKKHPEINIVTRDRASSYSKAIKTALPSSVQIADRFHIVKNLSERVYDAIKINYPAIKEGYINSLNEQKLRESAEDSITQMIAENNEKDESCGEAENEVLNSEPGAQRKLEQKEVLYNKIHELHKDRMSSRKIAAAVHVNKETVLKYLKYDMPPKDIIVYRNNYEAYLDIISDEIGHGRNITEIFKRIEKKGFKGKLSAFSSWFGKKYPDYK